MLDRFIFDTTFFFNFIIICRYTIILPIYNPSAGVLNVAHRKKLYVKERPAKNLFSWYHSMTNRLIVFLFEQKQEITLRSPMWFLLIGYSSVIKDINIECIIKQVLLILWVLSEKTDVEGKCQGVEIIERLRTNFWEQIYIETEHCDNWILEEPKPLLPQTSNTTSKYINMY